MPQLELQQTCPALQVFMPQRSLCAMLGKPHTRCEQRSPGAVQMPQLELQHSCPAAHTTCPQATPFEGPAVTGPALTALAAGLALELATTLASRTAWGVAPAAPFASGFGRPSALNGAGGGGLLGTSIVRATCGPSAAERFCDSGVLITIGASPVRTPSITLSSGRSGVSAATSVSSPAVLPRLTKASTISAQPAVRLAATMAIARLDQRRRRVGSGLWCMPDLLQSPRLKSTWAGKYLAGKRFRQLTGRIGHG